MSAKTEAKIHEKALRQFAAIQSVVRQEREQCLEDRRFYSISGAQWEGPLGEQFENKPRMEVNKVHLSVIRIINEYRNNRVSVSFLNKDGNDSASEVCQGLLRADEQDSHAQEAYDNAFEEAVGGGMGAWRLRADYDDDDEGEDDYQRIKFEPITDADTCVFFDLAAKRKNKSDAKYCFVLTPMTKESYEEEYEDDVESWPKDIQTKEFDWCSDETVFVAEYYVVEEVYENIYVYEDLTGVESRFRDQDFIDDPDLKKMLNAIGSKEVRQRKVEKQKVHKYILSGGGILEDCGYIAGKYIPIIVTYGKRWVIDNIERCMGHVRLQKDAQRIKNMQLSKLAEISALSPVQKPILTPEQVAGHEERWAEDNIKDYPYMLVNSSMGPNGETIFTGPVGMTQPPAVPPALGALLQLTDTDLRDLAGNQGGGDEIVSGVSGKAVEMIQTRLDMQTFIYMSNFGDAQRWSGTVWLAMARELYVEAGRKMKTIGSEDAMGTVELMRPNIGEDGSSIFENDLSKANFDVVVDVGPSSSSKKAATVRALTGMKLGTQDPETISILDAMAMMNMEGEGIKEAREFFRKKLVRMGVVTPNEEDKAEMAAEQAARTDPNAEYLKAAAEEATAKAAKARADTVETIANAELKRAQAKQITQELGAQQGPDYEGAKLKLESAKASAEIEIKNRELELKEQEHALKMAEAGAKVVKDAEGKKQIRNAQDVMAATMAEKVVGAVESLKSTLMENNQKMMQSTGAMSEHYKKASEQLAKPKKIVREKGKIVGIE